MQLIRTIFQVQLFIIQYVFEEGKSTTRKLKLYHIGIYQMILNPVLFLELNIRKWN